jgi:predicted nucleotidyltransferase
MFQIQSALSLPPLNGAPPRDRAIVATLLYYDLFAFPLRADEVVRFAHRPRGEENFHARDVAKCNAWWDSRSAFWFLKGRDEWVQHRAQRQAASAEKLARARKYARLLQLIPGVRFIGVTGSLAMESAVPEDDIDFLIIAQKNRLWFTRALVLSALLAWGVKRPDNGGAEYPNLICANIFLSEEDLRVPDENLFIAHEICQMLPLLGADTYRAFLTANAWVKNYLPQWQPARCSFQDHASWRRIQRAFESGFANSLGACLEQQMAQRQLERIHGKHARGHNPNVKLTPTQLRFHPRDLSDYVINTFNARWHALSEQ